MRNALALLASLAWIACGSSEPSEPPPDTPVSHTPGDEGPGDVVAAPPADCPPGSRPHQGAPEGCDFVAEGCCFESAEDACAHAGCAQEGCAILESYPAQVRCD